MEHEDSVEILNGELVDKWSEAWAGGKGGVDVDQEVASHLGREVVRRRSMEHGDFVELPTLTT